MGAAGKLTPSQPGDRSFNEQGGQNLDEVALSISAGRVHLKEVLIKDLPLYLVFTSLVFAAGLPEKEFLSSEEFEDYLARYAGEKFEKTAERKKFIKRQKNNAVIVGDEIVGETAWLIDEEDFDYARLCGFGVLKSEAKLYYMFQTVLGKDLQSQMAAFQALAHGMVDCRFLPLFATGENRARFKEMIGEAVYSRVLKALGI